MSVRVAVVDDQAIVRDGLVVVLSLLDDIEVVGEAADGAGAIELVERERPDVVLMDLRMPHVDGVAATAAITAAHPAIAVLVLTTFNDDASIDSALAAGARGYLTKDAGRAEIAAAIRSVAAGGTVLARSIGTRLVDRLTRTAEPAPSAPGPGSVRQRFPDLTPREADVVELVARGLTSREIAATLFLTPATVKSYVTQVFAKLQVATRAEAVARVLDPGTDRG